MKKNIILILTLSQFAFAADPESGIKSWDDLTVSKGYVLSVDLQKKECPNIWSKQIKLFKQENPAVKDPNLLSINQKIKVQSCQVEVAGPVMEKAPEVMPKEAEVLPPAPKVETPVVQAVVKEKEAKNLVQISAESNSIQAQDGDSAKAGYGVKLELGRHFETTEGQDLKVSLGILWNRTKSIQGQAVTDLQLLDPTLDLAYTFKVSDDFKLGPALSVIYDLSDATFRDVTSANTQTVGVYGGADLGLRLNSTLGLDAKVLNALENRTNLIETLGLEINF